MSLKSKVSLIMSLLFFVSGTASVAVNRLVIMPSFLELEREQAQRNVERAVEALQRDLDVLSTNVTAWAWWDESKRYMEGQNDEFVQRELSADPVSSAEVSYMGFYRTTGAQVIHRAPAAAEPGDVIEAVSNRYLGGIAEPSQRAKMAESGRRILQFVADNDFKTAVDPILFQSEARPMGPHAEAWLAAYRMTPEGRGFSGVTPALRNVLGIREAVGATV